MIFKYKDLEKHKSVELNYEKIKSSKVAFINSINIGADGVTKLYDVIDEADIELIAENQDELDLLSQGMVNDTTLEPKFIISVSNPTPKSNVRPAGNTQEFIWINRITGEMFICTDYTIDKNVWVGQLSSSKVITTGYTLEGIESNGLVAHFSFDVITGNQFYSTTSGVNAILNNVSQSSNAINGKSSYYKGRGFLTLSNEEFFKLNDFTIAYWVYPSHFRWNQNHVSKGKGEEFSIWQDTDGKMNVSYLNSKGVYTTTTSERILREDEWNHIAIVKKNGSITIKLDNFTDTNIVINGEYTSKPTYTDYPVYIGAGTVGSFVGNLDDMYLFSRDLVDEELDKIYTKFDGV